MHLHKLTFGTSEISCLLMEHLHSGLKMEKQCNNNKYFSEFIYFLKNFTLYCAVTYPNEGRRDQKTLEYLQNFRLLSAKLEM